MKTKALIIFTRVPVPGETKTRLMPYFTPRQCAKLHICFLEDIAAMCRRTEADIYICYTKGLSGKTCSGKADNQNVSGAVRGVFHNVCKEREYQEDILYQIFGESAGYFPQEGEDLGQRMYLAIKRVMARGYKSCVLIGTDVPQVQWEDIRQAFEVLKTKDIVLGPTADGGYYLVGMKAAEKEVFENQTYGHGSVLYNTIRTLESKGMSVGLGRRQYDIDTREDVREFRDRMRMDKSLQKTKTAKYLMQSSRISVIVPIYNEEKTIKKLLESLKEIKDRCEIILVDGGSTDKTLEYISADFKLIHSEKGRAKQMNQGAVESTGDILFFLHCDSELPEQPLEQIRSVMKNYRVGCFGIAFHSKNFFMFTCRVISNHRVRDRNIVFGDQGIFIDRKLFFDIGMFPELPVMEDYQFSLCLKARGEKIGITRKRIYTSDRRFPPGTVLKLREMWRMNRLRKKYRDGMDITVIADMYADVR